MANPTVQSIVVELIQSAMPGAVLSDDEWVARMSSGEIESFWVLDEEGQQAGLIAFQVGVLPERQQRCMYIVAACVAPHISDAGWMRLFGFGRLLARERGCLLIQFDTSVLNPRVMKLGSLLGCEREEINLVTGSPGLRFTVEV